MRALWNVLRLQENNFSAGITGCLKCDFFSGKLVFYLNKRIENLQKFFVLVLKCVRVLM